MRSYVDQRSLDLVNAGDAWGWLVVAGARPDDPDPYQIDGNLPGNAYDLAGGASLRVLLPVNVDANAAPGTYSAVSTLTMGTTAGDYTVDGTLDVTVPTVVDAPAIQPEGLVLGGGLLAAAATGAGVVIARRRRTTQA